MGLFGNKTKSLAKEISKEVFEFSIITVHRLNDLSQSSENDEDIYKKWEVADNDDIQMKLAHEFQIFLLYSLSWQSSNILTESKHKTFMDNVVKYTINKTPNINNNLVAKRYSEYTQYKLFPIDENLEFAPDETDNSALGRFSYHLSNILEDTVNPIIDGTYLFSLVNQFIEARNIQSRFSKL
ncbi:hypothetical protein [Halothermothrix orenii]|uniref:Uncharacterized protein n=1 Tax=Halothermothrix orenii (strain H 168 / OCM 544 / DSM 9562) TaxID=373903 RepID=B8CXW0_HALOH|nr:hypothetical protein [Halothermothrix orenii]ACL70129.1 hypothetical protein Hore_13770 [Halothermothrix orenii H 168]